MATIPPIVGNQREKAFFICSQKKNAQLVYRDYIYNKKQTQINGNTIWRCCESAKLSCRAVCTTINNEIVSVRRNHNHSSHWDRCINRELFLTEQDINDNEFHENMSVDSAAKPNSD